MLLPTFMANAETLPSLFVFTGAVNKSWLWLVDHFGLNLLGIVLNPTYQLLLLSELLFAFGNEVNVSKKIWMLVNEIG